VQVWRSGVNFGTTLWEEAAGAQPRLGLGSSPAVILVVVAHTPLCGWRNLRRCLSPAEGFLLVAAQRSPEQLRLQCRKLAPCVLVIDEPSLESLEWPELGAADYGRAVRVLVVGTTKDDRTVQSLVRMGYMGFVDEAVAPSVLKKAVRAVACGELWAGRRVIADVVQQLLCSLNSPKLTPRENEILKLIARGLKNRAIAEKLCITHETVRWHIRSLHSKLGLQDRLGTALYAQTLLREEPLAVAASAERER